MGKKQKCFSGTLTSHKTKLSTKHCFDLVIQKKNSIGVRLNQIQKSLRTRWGIALKDFNELGNAYTHIPKKYKRLRRMIKHSMDGLEKKMQETEKEFIHSK